MTQEQILKYIQETVSEIMNRVITAKDLLDDNKSQALIDAIKQALDRLGLTFQDVIPNFTTNNYFKGVDEASALLSESGLEVTGGLALARSGMVAKGFRKKIHLEAVQAIAGDMMDDLLTALSKAKESAEVNIKETVKAVKKDIAKGLIVGDSSKVVSQRVQQSFIKHGLTAISKKDKNGVMRRLPLDFYCNTVVSTKMREANTQGATNRYIENGVKLVQVDTHAPTCKTCAKYEGMVICISGNVPGFKSIKDKSVKLPPYHPNCQHTIRPYMTEFKTQQEIQKEKDKWKRWNPEKDDRSAANKKAYEKEQAIRRRVNTEKKQYAKIKVALGDKAPKTIGAYRRMKRANSKSWQKLQAEYRSAIRQI